MASCIATLHAFIAGIDWCTPHGCTACNSMWYHGILMKPFTLLTLWCKCGIHSVVGRKMQTIYPEYC